jgi:hypothetical protein
VPVPVETTETTAEHVFSGVINYDSLAAPNWAELEEADKQARCAEFFAANIENEPALSIDSTGPEITSWYKNRLLALGDLSLDQSNPLNLTAANNLADCMTLTFPVSGSKGSGYTLLSNQVSSLNQSYFEGEKMIYMEPDQVTRYSDGTFPAFGKSESGDTFGYSAFAVEGRLNDNIGNQPGSLVMNYFQWSPETNSVKWVLETPTESGGINPYFGDVKPPVVLDPMRQSAPNTLEEGTFQD